MDRIHRGSLQRLDKVRSEEDEHEVGRVDDQGVLLRVRVRLPGGSTWRMTPQCETGRTWKLRRISFLVEGGLAASAASLFEYLDTFAFMHSRHLR